MVSYKYIGFKKTTQYYMNLYLKLKGHIPHVRWTLAFWLLWCIWPYCLSSYKDCIAFLCTFMASIDLLKDFSLVVYTMYFNIARIITWGHRNVCAQFTIHALNFLFRIIELIVKCPCFLGFFVLSFKDKSIESTATYWEQCVYTEHC